MWKCWYAWLCLYVVTDTEILQSVSGTLPDIATLCPYNDFCHSKATKIRKPDELNLIPCCERCSCEPDCQLFGNCCPDKKMKSNVSVKYPCVNLKSYFNHHRGIKAMGYGDIYFRVVDDCSNVEADRTYPRCSDATKLEDFVLVSDPLTERVYKNKHCALCNGVADYIEWPLLTDCPGSITGRNVEEWYSYITENCSIIPLPPDQNAGSLVRCYHSQITGFEKRIRCNYTGRWETYNKDIDFACNVENPYTNNIYTRDSIDVGLDEVMYHFENVYCKFCNKRHDEVWPDLCENIVPYIYYRKQPKFSVLINFRTPAIEEHQMASKCHRSQMWNPFNESCMNIICPNATLLHKGTCKDIYTRMPGQTYGLIFRIKSNNGVNAYTRGSLWSIHYALNEWFDSPECPKCGTALKVDSNSNYYLEYLVNTQGSCTEQFLLSKLENVVSKSSFTLHVSYGITITLSFMLSPDVGKLPILMSISLERCPFVVHVSWEIIDKCPRIPISYLDSSDSITQITTVRHGTLCVDEYFEIMASLHNSQITAHAQISVAFVIFLWSVISILDGE